MDTRPVPAFRSEIEAYIQQHALPVDKFSHQPRLYALARSLAESEKMVFDDDILHAAIWLHDIGVFEGHRPSNPELLAKWDNVAYACNALPALLECWQFPTEKIPVVIDAIRQHAAPNTPSSHEAILLHDADLLELLGAVGIMRALSKVGRDTRYPTHAKAVAVLETLLTLPQFLLLPTAKKLAEPRVILMQQFLSSIADETLGVSY